MGSKFHERFDITIDIEESKRRFVNRVQNLIFFKFFYTALSDSQRSETLLKTASFLGEKYLQKFSIERYVDNNFYRCVAALEAFYKSINNVYLRRFENLIHFILEESEIDLGITWKSGVFFKTGAKLLDEELVNENLRWLSDQKYKIVLEPFTRGLHHFLESEKHPQILSSVITDMYEALEALAKIITERDKDLSGNAELFIKKLGVSDSYKRLVKEYISFANEFRHASKKGVEKPKLSIPEVESFIYMTGLFIRLATKM